MELVRATHRLVLNSPRDCEPTPERLETIDDEIARLTKLRDSLAQLYLVEVADR